MKKLYFQITLLIGGLFCLAYFFGWHTHYGRSILGVSSIEFVNNSNDQINAVTIYMNDSRGKKISQHYERIAPNSALTVQIRNSDLVFERVICERGQITFEYNEEFNVTPGEILEITLDSQGSFSVAHQY